MACLEWQRMPNAKMRRDLHARRRHFFNKRVSLVNYLSPRRGRRRCSWTIRRARRSHELGQSLTEIEVHGRFFGACSLTIVLYDRDARRLDGSVAECVKAFAAHDGALYRGDATTS